ncbi:DJ-1 family glyoxalase III [Clostridium paraputrificum]|uniref:DJ-1 family glyoxalase III n=1 Tax=Clostridium TaxID=1485 RepID=UPI003D350CDF
MKKVAVLLAEGFEEIEALTVVDIVRRVGITCDMVSIGNIDVTGAHEIVVKADKCIGDDLKEYDLLVLPGGMPGARNLQNHQELIEFIKYFNENNKLIAAICAAPIVLAKADIIKGKDITSYPGFDKELKGCNYKEENVVVDGNIITSRGPATAMEFSYKLLELLGNKNYIELKEGMMYNSLIK